MRRLIAFALLSTLVLAAPASAQLTHIRPGVSAGGVDLSGLTVPDAATKLDAELGSRMAPDLIIGVAGRPWTLKVGEAKLRLDSVRTAKRALYANAAVTQVAPAISHSRAAVKAFVERIAKQVGKPARDARIKITLRHIYRERSRPGRGLDVAAARKAIDAALDDPAAPRVLHERLTRVRAKVNANDHARVARVHPHARGRRDRPLQARPDRDACPHPVVTKASSSARAPVGAGSPWARSRPSNSCSSSSSANASRSPALTCCGSSPGSQSDTKARSPSSLRMIASASARNPSPAAMCSAVSSGHSTPTSSARTPGASSSPNAKPCTSTPLPSNWCSPASWQRIGQSKSVAWRRWWRLVSTISR